MGEGINVCGSQVVVEARASAKRYQASLDRGVLVQSSCGVVVKQWCTV